MSNLTKANAAIALEIFNASTANTERFNAEYDATETRPRIMHECNGVATAILSLRHDIARHLPKKQRSDFLMMSLRGITVDAWRS